MRLIDADALFESLKDNGTIYKDDFKNNEFIYFSDALDLIINAPTVQREEHDKRAGWISVPIEPTKEMQEAAIDNYMECPDCISWTGIYKAMIQAAPTNKE